MPDGATLRQHYEMAMAPPQEYLNRPDMPDCGLHIWQWFVSLRNACGDKPISFGEVDSWVRVTGISATAWEVQTIMQMDAAFLIGIRKSG